MIEGEFSPVPSSPVRAIVFDLGGVLVDNTGIGELEHWMASPVPATELWHRWLLSPSVRAFESGRIDARTFATRIIAELDLRVRVETFFQAIASLIRGPYPGAFALLDELRADYRVACLSNTNEIHWQRMVGEFGLLAHLDLAVASHLVGALKPDETIYRTLLARLGLPPDQVLFLDDHPLNVEAARGIGLPSAWVRGLAGARAALRQAGILAPE